MADITMCYGIDCARKESCYRFTAKPSPYQYMFYPLQSNGDCAEYWDNSDKPKYTEDWQPESRDRAIAQNGNDGLHYNKEK